MTLLTKDQILEASDMTSATVDVPEWGGSVCIRTMTGTDRDAFEASMVEIDAAGHRSPDMRNLRAKLVAMTAIDDAGNRLFDLADIPLLARKNAAALDRVFTAAQKLNGLADDAVEDATKNSVAGLAEGSPSD
jgi:hypothetical protein